tara:strand:- start:4344 stop:5255 length:912 start_codon:yes stop_codon:yes gene_type:complete
MGLASAANAYYGGSSFGTYQFISLKDIINNFIVAYVGEGKIISKIKRGDIQFHAQRAIQELSFDTFKSTKSQEIEIPPSLVMVLPHDYVNYVKLTWIDGNGLEHIIYPTRYTSNPFSIKQDTDGSYSFDANDDGVDDSTDLVEQDSTNNISDTWNKYKNMKVDNNVGTGASDDLDTDIYDYNEGQRYGIEPETAQVNGSFFIDNLRGKIHFSSNIKGKTVILKYISDSLGTDAEIQVHKFAEEAMYKWIAHAILSTRSQTQEYLVARFKKERTAEIRKAKLRLSNLKLEELTQILRGKSKQIK